LEGASTKHAHLLILLLRFALGWYVMLSGWDKIQDELTGGFGTYLQSGSYQRRNPPWLPPVVATSYGYALPWAEAAFGLLLALGLFGRTAAAGIAVILLSIAVALLGVGELLPRHHIMVFFPVALLLIVHGPGKYSLDGFAMRR
jgi:uncharacterized membrane protein YphA (DoxX/SURF4 family)